MKFTLLQLIACVGFILIITLILINLPKGNSSSNPEAQPVPTIPFMEIKMK